MAKTLKLSFLREWREHRDLSQEELAAQIGKTQGFISQLENGKCDFTGKILRLLGKALDCEPADLLQRNPLDPEQPWSVWNRLTPSQRRQGIRVLKALEDDDRGNPAPSEPKRLAPPTRITGPIDR